MSKDSEGSVPTTTAATDDVLNLHGVYAINEIMVDILSRLPAKSLMRFKCVSKSWLSLIKKNKHFFSLHSRRSKSNNKILIVSHYTILTCPPWELGTSFFTLDLFKRSIKDVTNIPRTWDDKCIHGPVNGLLCFVDDLEGCVLIYNLCTKEQSPWITSNIWKNNGHLFGRASGFGFDPVTQEHKVLLVWQQKNNYREIGAEVLTVGQNTWRTIHQLPPVIFQHTFPIYLNGSIYWFISTCPPEERLENILAFDVGKEKFRLIKPPPNGIRYRRNYEFILEVDGQLAIMERMVYDDQKKVTEMRVWTFIDQEEEGENNYKWIWEMIELPFCMENYETHGIQSIPGKKLLMITSRIADLDEHPFIYFYDMKMKNFSEYGSLPWPENKFKRNFRLLVLEESIYPVGAQVDDGHYQMIITSPPPPPPPLVDNEEWSNTGILINLCFLGLFSALYVFSK